MSDLRQLLEKMRLSSPTVRDQGTAFEHLMIDYFRYEPQYRELYNRVRFYGAWVKEYGQKYGLSNRADAGIDLVATTVDGQHHAIQCKNYDPDRQINKEDIDSFFTASGKTYFANRIIVSTTNHWSRHATEALRDQQIPVSTITLETLENSALDWGRYRPGQTPTLKAGKTPLPHQEAALANVLAGFNGGANRGKLIMACGTGKTFTALNCAEALAGVGHSVLFLVPSLALLNQTLREWAQDSRLRLRNFAVCSDDQVGKRDDDGDFTGRNELEYPATTTAADLARAVARQRDGEHMTVIYATYHSIDVIHRAQREHGLAPFDLIICDEAHRTTGASRAGEEESAFVRVHDGDYLQGAKRLYMTATPRIYDERVKQDDSLLLYSMDDEDKFGPTFHSLSFASAVRQGLLVDYKVIVLAIDEAHINRRLQNLLSSEDNDLRVDDAAKIVGCWKALSRYDLDGDDGETAPMRRAVAFCQVIEEKSKSKTPKVSSKRIAATFGAVVEAYQESERAEWQRQWPDLPLPPALSQRFEAQHVDGKMNALEKEEKLRWLKAEDADNSCRILSNVRCLSEGVDVPALDAVLFLTPRSSLVDVVQSVGRVMRRAPGKKLGYVILPVVIPAGVRPEEALNNNEKYRVIWQVLNALRAHDQRMNATINRLEFEGSEHQHIEVVAVGEALPPRREGPSARDPVAATAGKFEIGEPDSRVQEVINFGYNLERALYAKIVQKCGDRRYWGTWAQDIGRIAQTHINRIRNLLDDPGRSAERAAFARFAAQLRQDLNNQLKDDDIIEMLAQHLITQPVFEALFGEYAFAAHNPVSQAMAEILALLYGENLHKEREHLQSFYDDVRHRAEGINSGAGKQKVIIELYDQFFRSAFPRMAERLGIVYTPVEVVDFIIHSVDEVLRQEFGRSLADRGVHILDPFTGTGTFITRLLQSGLIAPEALAAKYRHEEIHANEIVLLAYYIAAINIEATFHDLMAAAGAPAVYEPFTGICLTDTFDMYERKDLLTGTLPENSARRQRQKAQPIQVIIGNPPYSAGQESANDNNANLEYPPLDERIRQTYAAHSQATNKNSTYDSYIRAFRWASDRINEKGGEGVIGFVTNAGWLDSNSSDGLRHCLAEEFSRLYIFHLRGNARTSGEQRRKEKGNVFGEGSRAPIAISLLVKNPRAGRSGQIFFHDIGDYLSREEKLATIAELGSINGIAAGPGWQTLVPDRHNDWLNQRDDSFERFISLGAKNDKSALTVFENYSGGVKTNRDVWCYNFSRQRLQENMANMIAFYNSEVERFQAAGTALPKGKRSDIKNFVSKDDTKISWSENLTKDFSNQKFIQFEEKSLQIALYRPFSKSYIYFSRDMNERVYQMPSIFPSADAENQAISVTGRGAKNGFSALMNNHIPDLNSMEAGAQCFPKDIFEEMEDRGSASLSERANSEQRTANILPKRFPANRVICLTLGGTKGFSVLMADEIPDLHLIGDAQCFPLFLYEEEEQ